MTVRTRRTEKVGIRARLGGMVDTEERQQTAITVFFIATIVLVALIFLGAMGVGWYNDNIRALGSVGGTSISPQMVRDAMNIEQWQIARDEGRITQAQIAGTLDADTATSKTSALDSQSQSLTTTTATSALVDLIYQSQLAPANGINVTDADIDARFQQEISGAEQRHVYAVAIAPTAADATNGPTTAERQAALAQANQALADLNAGKDFATVAAQYGTDTKSKAGGDLGTIPQIAVSDTTFGQELWKLPANGTTGVIVGADGTYYIGHVTDITPGTPDNALKNKLLANVSEASVRQQLGWHIASEQLQDKIVGTALSATPEQVKLATIYIEGLAAGSSTDTNTTDGEIDYSEIVFAPGDNQSTASSLSPDDPAWAAAKTEADSTVATLQAITDVTERTTKFSDTAKTNSDDPTSSDGGKVGFVTRDVPPAAISDALWNGTFNKGDIIGPVKSDDGYYVLMFNERRASADDRVKSVTDALAQPNADFAALAKQWSDGPEKDTGGELGWFTKDGLSSTIVDQVWGMTVGQVTIPPLELGQGRYFIKLEDRAVRPLDADQQAVARQTAFSNWYQPQKDAATADGTINTITPASTAADLTGGGDQTTP